MKALEAAEASDKTAAEELRKQLEKEHAEAEAARQRAEKFAGEVCGLEWVVVTVAADARACARTRTHTRTQHTHQRLGTQASGSSKVIAEHDAAAAAREKELQEQLKALEAAKKEAEQAVADAQARLKAAQVHVSNRQQPSLTSCPRVSARAVACDSPLDACNANNAKLSAGTRHWMQ